MIAKQTREVATQGGAIRLAVLHQAMEPPIIDGVKKAMKPGGYQDSSADIAYVLRHYPHSYPKEELEIEVVTPTENLNPKVEKGWSFPDTEAGIISAIREHKATHFWANTVLFANHPLQTCNELTEQTDQIYMVGQPPQLVQKYDNKNWVNEMLKKDTRFSLPLSRVITSDSTNSTRQALQEQIKSLTIPFPVIGKPIRGRGSHGVKLCRTIDELTTHLEEILSESPQVMVEEYLAGQEGTVTVMPPSEPRPKHWAFPVVERFNHADGVAPYNGIVAVIQNSRVVPLDEQAYHLTPEGEVDVNAIEDLSNPYADIRKQCELVAESLGCTAPIRIDVRRKKEGGGDTTSNRFVMFDVNMKPNMTGPGRPGREQQASLTAMAAQALGWDYSRLLREMLETARPLSQVRAARLPDGLGG